MNFVTTFDSMPVLFDNEAPPTSDFAHCFTTDQKMAMSFWILTKQNVLSYFNSQLKAFDLEMEYVYGMDRAQDYTASAQTQIDLIRQLNSKIVRFVTDYALRLCVMPTFQFFTQKWIEVERQFQTVISNFNRLYQPIAALQ